MNLRGARLGALILAAGAVLGGCGGAPMDEPEPLNVAARHPLGGDRAAREHRRAGRSVPDRQLRLQLPFDAAIGKLREAGLEITGQNCGAGAIIGASRSNALVDCGTIVVAEGLEKTRAGSPATPRRPRCRSAAPGGRTSTSSTLRELAVDTRFQVVVTPSGEARISENHLLVLTIRDLATGEPLSSSRLRFQRRGARELPGRPGVHLLRRPADPAVAPGARSAGVVFQLETDVSHLIVTVFSCLGFLRAGHATRHLVVHARPLSRPARASARAAADRPCLYVWGYAGGRW